MFRRIVYRRDATGERKGGAAGNLEKEFIPAEILQVTEDANQKIACSSVGPQKQ